MLERLPHERIDGPEGTLFDDVAVANTFWSQTKGLLGQDLVPVGSGLLIRDCTSIHCLGMRCTIDVVYLTDDLMVLGIETVRPWHLGHAPRHTRQVLELAEGAACDMTVGMRLTEHRVAERQVSDE